MSKTKQGSEIEKALKVLEFIISKKTFRTKDIQNFLGITDRGARNYVRKLVDALGDYIKKIRNGEYEWNNQIFSDKILKNVDLEILYMLIKEGEKIGRDKKMWKNLKNSIAQYKSNYFLSGKSIKKDIFKTKNLIENAIKEGKNIKFKYSKSNKSYEVSPYGVVFLKGIWYLAGRDKKQDKLKTFALHFIQDVGVESDNFFEKTREIKNIQPLLEEAESVWQITNQEELEEVTVEVNNDILHYFKNKDYFKYQAIIAEHHNGNAKIKFKVCNDMDFKMQVIKWIPAIRVVEPEKYKNIFINLLKETLKFQNKEDKDG